MTQVAANNGPGTSSPGWLAVRFRALRAFSLPVSVLPVPLAVAAVLPVSRWNWPVLIASTLAAGLLHCAGNILNDYFDFHSGVDRKLDDDENRPGRQLVKGNMTAAQTLSEGLACLALAMVLSAYLIWQCGSGLLWFAAAGVVALYSYTGPPLQLKYRALGEPVIFLTFGPLLMLGAAYTQIGSLDWQAILPAILASLPVGLATTAILVGNNIRDLDEDSAAGIVTLAGVIGHGRLRAVYVCLVTMAVLSVAGMAAGGLLPRVLLAVPILLALLAKPLACVISNHRLPDIDAQTAKFETVMLLAMIAAFVADKWNIQ